MRTVAGIRLLLGLLLFSMLTAGWVNAGWRDGNSKAATEAEACVRERDWMRRNHFDLIRHDRDVTVHKGIRTLDGSMSACIACHANRDEQGDFIAVNQPGQFCAGCHQYTGVTFDCFSCHATTPADGGK